MSPIWHVLGLYIGAPVTMCFRSHGPFVKYEILVLKYNVLDRFSPSWASDRC
jgi:hypothetical protein